MTSRVNWSSQLLTAVENKLIDSQSVSATNIANLMLHSDDDLQRRVRKIWGDTPDTATDEMRGQIDRLNQVIRSGSGVPNHGKPLFIEHCGKCHRLFEDGGDIGPNLTQHDRSDLRQLLINIVSPSLSLREGFESYVVVTNDGRTLSGLLVDQDNQVIIIKNHEGQTQVIERSDIEELEKSTRSLMPADTLGNLSEQQTRDLFAYLRSSQPLP